MRGRKRCDHDGRRREAGSFLLLTPGLFSQRCFSPFLSSPRLLCIHIPSHFLFIIGQELKKRGEKVVDDRSGTSHHSSSYYLPIIHFSSLLHTRVFQNFKLRRMWWSQRQENHSSTRQPGGIWRCGFCPELNKLPFWSGDMNAHIHITARVKMQAGIKEANVRHQQRLERGLNTSNTKAVWQVI